MRKEISHDIMGEIPISLWRSTCAKLKKPSVIDLFCESGAKETPWLSACEKLMQMAKPIFFIIRLANRDNQIDFRASCCGSAL